MFREKRCGRFWCSGPRTRVAYGVSVCTDGDDASNGIGGMKTGQSQTRTTAGLIDVWASSAMILG